MLPLLPALSHFPLARRLKTLLQKLIPWLKKLLALLTKLPTLLVKLLPTLVKLLPTLLAKLLTLLAKPLPTPKTRWLLNNPTYTVVLRMGVPGIPARLFFCLHSVERQGSAESVLPKTTLERSSLKRT